MKKPLQYVCADCGYSNHGHFDECPSCESTNVYDNDLSEDTEMSERDISDLIARELKGA